MTPFEQAVAREYGTAMGCLVADCRFGLDSILKRGSIRSAFTVHGAEYWMNTGKRAIELRGSPADTDPALVRWRDVTAHIRRLPDWQREQAHGLCRMKHQALDGTNGAIYDQWMLLRGLTADVLRKAFPDADQPDALDLFTASGI